MPTYDYVCEACGHEFEHFQSMTDRHLRTCPKCKKKKLIRKVGAGAGLIFKGSGFYVTDYKKSGAAGGQRDGEKKSGDESKPTEKCSEGSTTPKEAPAAKTDSKPIGKAKKEKDS